VNYFGKHIRNIHDKSNTFTVEGVNADLRHYIPCGPWPLALGP
jgi:hypothetical protein